MGHLRLVLEKDDINRIINELGYSGYGRITGIEDEVIHATVNPPGPLGGVGIWLTNFGVEENDVRATVGASNFLIKTVMDSFVGKHDFGPVRYEKPTLYVRVPPEADRFIAVYRIYLENHTLVIEATSKLT